MSIYAQAMVSGVNALQVAFTGANAQTRAAFTAQYQAETAKRNAMEMKSAAQKNIGAVRQDKILSNLSIRLEQGQAEALVKMNAAAAGVEGQSVADARYETVKNAAFATSKVDRLSRQQIEEQLSKIGSAQSALLSVEEPKISLWGAYLDAAASVSKEDIQGWRDSADKSPAGESGGKDYFDTPTTNVETYA